MLWVCSFSLVLSDLHKCLLSLAASPESPSSKYPKPLLALQPLPSDHCRLWFLPSGALLPLLGRLEDILSPKREPRNDKAKQIGLYLKAQHCSHLGFFFEKPKRTVCAAIWIERCPFPEGSNVLVWKFMKTAKIQENSVSSYVFGISKKIVSKFLLIGGVNSGNSLHRWGHTGKPKVILGFHLPLQGATSNQQHDHR